MKHTKNTLGLCYGNLAKFSKRLETYREFYKLNFAQWFNCKIIQWCCYTHVTFHFDVKEPMIDIASVFKTSH